MTTETAYALICLLLFMLDAVLVSILIDLRERGANDAINDTD